MPWPVIAEVWTTGQGERHGHRRSGVRDINFVLCHHGQTLRSQGDQFGVPLARFVIGNSMRCIQHHQHHVRLRQRLHGFAHANALGLIERSPDAGCVHQPHWNAADGDRLAHQVAGGAGRRRDDGAFALHQAIEQILLADIGTPHDGQRQAFVHNLSKREARQQLF